MMAVIIILSVVLAASWLPVAINSHLRNIYRQTLAHYLAKIARPPTVFIGDSIMTGGMWFDDLRNINLAANGLLTHQIAKYLPTAQSYNPHRIVIMAGINDAIQGTELGTLRPIWETICEEPKIVVTLVTPSIHDDLNIRIDRINSLIVEVCQTRPIVILDVADDAGRLKREFAADSIHLNEKGYHKWIAGLAMKFPDWN